MSKGGAAQRRKKDARRASRTGRAAPQLKEHYFQAGGVERGPSYEWGQGYSLVPHSESEGCQPWVTRREAQRESKARGALAVFHLTLDAARDSLREV